MANAFVMTIVTHFQRSIWMLCAICLFHTGCGDSNVGNQQEFRPTDEQQRKVQQHVESFIRAHEKWEIEAYDKWHSQSDKTVGNTLTERGAALLGSIKQSYIHQLKRFFVEGARIHAPGFGKPLRHESKYEQVSSIESRSDDFLVRTTMTRQNGPANITEHYEYVVVFENRQPKITELQWQPGD